MGKKDFEISKKTFWDGGTILYLLLINDNDLFQYVYLEKQVLFLQPFQ